MTREEIIHVYEHSCLVCENFTPEAVTAAYVEALSALRAQQVREKNEPLAQDELRGMVGEWAWVVVQYANSVCEGWALVATPALVCFLDQTLFMDTYGEKFVAYRRKPEEQQEVSLMKSRVSGHSGLREEVELRMMEEEGGR